MKKPLIRSQCMIDLHLKRHPSRLGRRLSLLGVVVVSALVWNIVTYIHLLHYGDSADNPKAGSPLQGELLVVLTGNKDRIPYALSLLRQRKNALLIVSGASPHTSLLDIIQHQQGAATGIHEVYDRILIESQATTTIENALETQALMRKKAIQPDRMVLITSRYHMPRALLTFRHFFPRTWKMVPHNVPQLDPWYEEAPKIWSEYWKFTVVRISFFVADLFQIKRLRSVFQAKTESQSS